MRRPNTKTPAANRRRSAGMLIASMLIFGTVGVVRRNLPFSSAMLAFSRGILGGLFLLGFVLLRKKGTGAKLPPRALPRLILTGALIGVNWMLLFEAYNHTTVAAATLCYYMEPAIVVLLSPLFFKERLTAKKAVCAAVAVVGMVLVSGVLGEGGAGGDIRGVLLGLGAACFYAAVVILNKKTPGIDAYLRTTVLLLSAGVTMLPYVLFTNGFRCEGAGAASVVLLLVLGVVHTGLAYTLYFGSMEGLPVQSIAVLSFTDPVSALLFSALLLREPLTLPGLIGAALIIGSAAVSET